MLLYLLYENKLSTFLLPKNISGNYIVSDYDHLGSKRNIINIEERNGIWQICSNYDNKLIYKKEYLDTAELKLFEFYQIQLYTGEMLLIYVAEAYANTIIQKQMLDNSTIIIGNMDECDIKYAGFNNLNQLQIEYKNHQYYITNINPTMNLYVNRLKKEKTILKNLDTIFCMGLRITVCGSSLFFIVPKQSLQILSHKFEEVTSQLITKDYQASADIYKDFYDEKEYYAKAPVFKNKLEPLELTIATPPPKQEPENESVMMTVIPSSLMCMTSVIMGYFAIKNFNNKDVDMETNILSLVMCISMLMACILWPFVERNYQNHRLAKKEKKRLKTFEKYLQEKEILLKKEIEQQRLILQNNNITLNECQKAILNRTPNLFSRNIEQEDFLTVRLGIGTVPLACNLQYHREEFTENEDTLRDQIDKIVNENKEVSNVPISLSLTEHNVVAFLSDSVDKKAYFEAILLQLITLQSYTDLKLIMLTDSLGENELSYMKHLNHCWSNDKSIRFFATTFEQGQILSSYLERELNDRTSENTHKDQKYAPFYLILSDNISSYRNLKIVKDILKEKKQVGFGLLIFDTKVSNVPNECDQFINYNKEQAAYFSNVMDKDTILYFKPEFMEATLNISECCRILANTPVKLALDEAKQIPNNVGFLEMYEVGNVEQLNTKGRWEMSTVTTSLAAPIGIDAFGNVLLLDLHEKKHGPHGLVAGMTGSGKSEFIITYILSLAVNYRPTEVQFVLIDYKGGGLAGAFENRKTGVKLPHLVGTITNLDKASMNRSLVSINSELQRRQRLFNETKEQLNIGTIDIYKYQKLYRENTITTPLSHLFIICDEFAELKDQQPEFMDQLISTARIGRSLGIHLILATQKPTGVVDDQIWSNSKFKICCKVQTEEDSKEMINRPDAAYIKEIGRFFLQVGYDEYFVEGQSAYTGRPYIPTNKVKSKVDNSINFVNTTGEIMKTVEDLEENKANNNTYGEELKNILEYLIKIASSQNFQYQQLWLENIPPKIYIEDIRKKYPSEPKRNILNPMIGEYDDPAHQTQGVVTLPITEGGNCFIAGMTGSGKTTLLKTLIYSIMVTHRSDEVNIYVIDLGLEALKQFERAPQVGEVLTVAEEEKIKRLFKILENEAEQRKKILSKTGGTYQSYCQEGNLPNIVIMINGIEVFKEVFDELYEETFINLTRDCNKYGITFIVTSTSSTGLGYRAENNFPQKIGLRLLDQDEYYNLFPRNDVLITQTPGRGLINLEGIYEFQTALLFTEETLETNLDYIFNELQKVLKKVKPIPTMPSIVTASSLLKNNLALNYFPIGKNIETVSTVYYNFTEPLTVISTLEEETYVSFTEAFLTIAKNCPQTKMIILDGLKLITNPKDDKIKYYDANFKPLMKYLKEMIPTIADRKDQTYAIVVMGYQKIAQHLEKLKEESLDEEVVTLDDIIELAQTTTNFKFIFLDLYASLKSIKKKSWYSLMKRNSGIWLGSGFEDQTLINAKHKDRYFSEEENIAYVITEGEVTLMKPIQGGDR